MKKANPLIYDMSQYFVQLTNCYYINVAGSYLSDEIGFMGLEDVHYEDKCYEETLNYIRYIVKNTPKQKYFASKKEKTPHPCHPFFKRILRDTRLNQQKPQPISWIQFDLCLICHLFVLFLHLNPMIQATILMKYKTNKTESFICQKIIL